MKRKALCTSTSYVSDASVLVTDQRNVREDIVVRNVRENTRQFCTSISQNERKKEVQQRVRYLKLNKEKGTQPFLAR